MAWTSSAGGTDGNRPPRPLVDLAEQLALAAAADFARRLADLVVLEDAPSGHSGADPASASPAVERSRSTGASTPDGELDRADAEELDLLRSRMHSLATLFSDKFTACVDEQVTTLWKQQLQNDDERPEGSDAAAAGVVPMKKGAKLRRSFKKKFGRKKHKESPEAEAERKQMKKLEKEGPLKQLIDIDGTSIQWVKCRVSLKRQPGGFMLSFFSPPKSTHPRSGIFCFLITEVRQTTHEELPDTEHSFVVRGENNMEYILLCHSNTDMWSWIAALRECSRLDSVKRNIKTGENGAGLYEVQSDDDDDDEPPPPPPPPDNASGDGIDPPPPPPDGVSNVPHPRAGAGGGGGVAGASAAGVHAADASADTAGGTGAAGDVPCQGTSAPSRSASPDTHCFALEPHSCRATPACRHPYFLLLSDEMNWSAVSFHKPLPGSLQDFIMTPKKKKEVTFQHLQVVRRQEFPDHISNLVRFTSQPPMSQCAFRTHGCSFQVSNVQLGFTGSRFPIGTTAMCVRNEAADRETKRRGSQGQDQHDTESSGSAAAQHDFGSCSYFQLLPPELVHMILAHCDSMSLRLLSVTCHYLRDMCQTMLTRHGMVEVCWLRIPIIPPPETVMGARYCREFTWHEGDSFVWSYSRAGSLVPGRTCSSLQLPTTLRQHNAVCTHRTVCDHSTAAVPFNQWMKQNKEEVMKRSDPVYVAKKKQRSWWFPGQAPASGLF
eukprot:scpid38057/ scgid2354/ SH2B adapter protein 2; Adapter protein with pleckstrin homology and Src homology 2 domains; SH2 and PH domain-containing adapter protein APS